MRCRDTCPPASDACATEGRSVSDDATAPTRTWKSAPGISAEQDPDAGDGHRSAHVKEQARARLQVPEGRAGVPFRVPGCGGIAVNRELGELVVLALTVPVWIERHCADRFKYVRAFATGA